MLAYVLGRGIVLADAPAKAPSALSLSFGGFNSIAIVTSSISILRLITAHEKITLHGIVADVVDWYKKFFHQTFDTFIDWINAFHINWLKFPHVPDSIKDIVIVSALLFMLLYRTAGVLRNANDIGFPIEYSRYRISYYISFFLIQALFALLIPFYAIMGLVSYFGDILNSHEDNLKLAYTIMFAVMIQSLSITLTVTSLLVFSAYS